MAHISSPRHIFLDSCIILLILAFRTWMQMTLFLNGNFACFPTWNSGSLWWWMAAMFVWGSSSPKGRCVKLAQARILRTAVEQREQTACLGNGNLQVFTLMEGDQLHCWLQWPREHKSRSNTRVCVLHVVVLSFTALPSDYRCKLALQTSFTADSDIEVVV